MNLTTLKWDPLLLNFFEIKPSVLPRIVSSSEVYGECAGGALKGVKIAGIAGDQQAALIGNKCLKQGEAKCTYGTGAFLLFCTGEEVVRSRNGLVATVSGVSLAWEEANVGPQVAYQAGPDAKPVYALEGSSAYSYLTLKST